MTAWVLGVAGRIASGKSTFIASFSEASGAHVTGFGDFVRKRALEEGLDAQSRDVLQEVGARTKVELGDAEFVRRVLEQADSRGAVVVDGVRHVEIADALEAASAPRPFFLVFLEVDDGTQQARATGRSRDADRLQELAAHSTESQVNDGSLRARANLVLDARRPVADLVHDALRLVGGA